MRPYGWIKGHLVWESLTNLGQYNTGNNGVTSGSYDGNGGGNKWDCSSSSEYMGCTKTGNYK